MKENKLAYAAILKNGSSIDYKDISICDLRNHCYWLKKRERGYYQVHSNKFTAIYEDINEAIEKFLELKGNK